jgi:ketosteroid isomerase-like protein
MRRRTLGTVVVALVAGAVVPILPAMGGLPPRGDNVTEDVLALYRNFANAQNRRDLDATRERLWDGPAFLWISDGKPFWGREAMLRRMAQFQTAAVWKVDPEYGSARVVEVGPEAAYLHIPLVLVLGSEEKPVRLRWLVEVLCRKTDAGWRIAALFTTEDKRP